MTGVEIFLLCVVILQGVALGVVWWALQKTRRAAAESFRTALVSGAILSLLVAQAYRLIKSRL